MHDQSFQHQQQLDDASAPSALASLGLDSSAFGKCLATGTGERLVQADEALGRKLSVTGTPTFFLGTVGAGGWVKVVRRFSGAPSASQFTSIVDAVLEQGGAKGDAKSGR